ncbi:MAG: type II secretion system protein [Phycisphaerales bacterium]|nr:MAG: type II secretion system protein [Phycisphaerales bacterium]
MKRYRRRGIMLAEMMCVIVLVGIGMTLVAGSMVAIIHTQKQADRLTDRYTVLHDFTSTLRKDVRGALNMVLEPDKQAGELVLTLDRPAGSTSYRFTEQCVQRTTFPEDEVCGKQWAFPRTRITCRIESPPSDRTALLQVSIAWLSLSSDSEQPSRRFDMTLRCLGGQHDDAR